MFSLSLFLSTYLSLSIYLSPSLSLLSYINYILVDLLIAIPGRTATVEGLDMDAALGVVDVVF